MISPYNTLYYGAGGGGAGDCNDDKYCGGRGNNGKGDGLLPNCNGSNNLDCVNYGNGQGTKINSNSGYSAADNTGGGGGGALWTGTPGNGGSGIIIYCIGPDY
jgi:hypothetical protein